MRNSKRFMTFVMATVLVVTSALPNFQAKADDTKKDGVVSVTLRIEDSQKTLVAETEISIDDETLKEVDNTVTAVSDDGITSVPMFDRSVVSGPSVADAIVAYALEKEENPAEFATFVPSYYGGCNLDAIRGDSAREGSYWMYYVNNEMGNSSFDQYELKDGDDIVLVYADCIDPVNYTYTHYSYFDNKMYSANVGAEISVKLSRYVFDESYNPVSEVVTGQAVICGDEEYVTDEKGEVKIKAKKAGEYAITSEEKNENGLFVNSRAYARLIVRETAGTATQTPAATQSPAATATSNPQPKVVTVPEDKTKIAKPDKVKGLKKKVYKSKKVKVSWNKVKGAKGYQVMYSKKKNKGYKKFALTTKNTASKKLSKGTYYFKVRAYVIDENDEKLYGTYSAKVKAKVK